MNRKRCELITVNKEIKEFLEYLSSEKGLATNTAAAYSQDLEQLFQFCALTKKSPLKVSCKDLREFVAHLRKQELSTRTIARKISTLKQFFKFLLREHKIVNDPADLLSIVQKTKRLPKHLTIEEVFRLIASAEGDTDLEIRDRALLEMWYATGARVSELAQLKSSQIDFQEKVVKIKGKGGKERIVPLSEDAVEWAKKYQALRHQWLIKIELKETKIFFLNRLGKSFTRQGIWKLVKKYTKKAGITRKVWPHMIRHSFATHVLRGGADLRAVQELLGHKSISTTEIYTHLAIENLKVMQLKYHPRD
ncbi:MAG: site-specific tyrosine recombinase XerD [Deltaproteobacteria bacterium]|nr:site-specific tyrosine recombinase XerD [Deltaproteobacteria bacterium]